jgi:flagellar protein FliL
MAEEDKEKEPEVVVAKEEHKGKTGQGIIFTVLVLVNTALIGAIGYFQFKGFQKEKKEETVNDLVKAEFAKRGVVVQGEKVIKEPLIEEGILINFDKFMVNLASSDGVKKYLRMSVVLKFSKESNEKEIKMRKAQITDSIISILNAKKAEDLLNREGKEYLKHEIKATVNSYLSEGRLLDLYYVNFQVN